MRWIRASLPVFALVMALVVLGHDAVMAANPHAQPATSVEHAGHEALDSTCHQQEGVRPGSFDAGQLLLPGASILAPSLAVSQQEDALIAWDAPPRHPPRVARALLQVFQN